jgi:prepilin-type N-terminal cleavage/methylation domain-containing protein
MKKKGFTLVELMIALSIFSIFLGFVYKVYFEEVHSLKSMGARSEIQYNANTAMELIAKQIRNNTQVNTFIENGKCTQLKSNGTVLIDVSGNRTNSNLYYDSTTDTLRDMADTVLCTDIAGVKIDAYGSYIEITLDLISWHEDYSLKTGFILN